jgi:DNA-directed RNA polymerase subunit alpha
MEYIISLPSKPRIVTEEGTAGTFEIDGLYPGYGHTLGNSLRRIILSSLPGAAITGVKIEGAPHEFSTIPGVVEDVVNILLNLKKVRISVATDEPQVLRLEIKGEKKVTAADFEVPGQASIHNPTQHIATLTDKSAHLSMEVTVERGLGYIAKEVLHKDRVDIGVISLDAIFSPIRRVNYEVENMRVGDRTDFNRLRIMIETDGTLSPREALEKSIETMIHQLKAVVGFKEEEVHVEQEENDQSTPKKERVVVDPEVLKTRIETLDMTARTANALANANIRTVGGLARKTEDDILSIEGLGQKGLLEIRKMLSAFNLTLRD